MKSALFAAGLLLASIMTMPLLAQQASAQTIDETKWIFLQLYANYSDGSKRILVEDTDFFRSTDSFTLIQDSKTIDSFTVKVLTAFTDNVLRLVTSNTVSSPSIKILAADGTYKSVPTTNADIQAKCLSGSTTSYCTAWQLYSLTLTRSSLEGLIGPTSGEKSSDLRVTFCNGCIKTIVKTQAGSTSNLVSPTLVINAGFTAKDITGGGGGTGTAPTGKLFYVITGKTNDGARWTITSTDIGTLKSADFLNVIGDGTPFDTIDFTMKLFLDKDDYLIQPEVLQFTDPGSTDNFHVLVEGHEIPITYEGGISSAGTGGTGLYQIMYMSAKRADIEPLITKEIATDGTTVWRSGSMTFFVQDAIITMKQGTQIWNIAVPEQHVKVDLFRTDVVDDDPGPCNIVGEVTTCPQPPGIELSGMALMLMVGAVAAGGIGGAVLLMKKPHRK